MGVPFLDALLGKLYSRGEPRELRGGLNFGAGIALLPSSLGYDVTLDPAVAVASLRDTFTTETAGPVLVPSLAQAVRENQMLRVEARYHFRGGGYEGYKVLLALFRRVDGGALAQWGDTIVGVDQHNGLSASGELVASGNDVVPRVTGASFSQSWTIDLVVRAY
jgi:hypothetical protein